MSPTVAVSFWKSKKVRGALASVPILGFALLILLIIVSAGILSIGEAEAKGDPYGDSCEETGTRIGVTFGGQMDVALLTIRTAEHISVRDSVKAGKLVGFKEALAVAMDTKIYSQPANPKNGTTASGAYQFVDRTWRAHQPSGSNYAHAYQAPVNIQDQAAQHMVEGILSGTSIDNLGPSWLLGHVPKGSEWDEHVGINPTARQYQTVWMWIYNEVLAVAFSGGGSKVAVPSETTSADAAEANAKAPAIAVAFKQKANPEDTVQVGDAYKGLASTYGNDPVTQYIDTGDNNQPALAGASNDQLGVAVYNRGTLGGWWYVTAPNGRSAILKQTDYGPSTSRMIDINAVAARSAFGYLAASFPTDQGNWTARYLGLSQPTGAAFIDTGGVGDTPAVDPPGVETPVPCNPGDVGASDQAGDAGFSNNVDPANLPNGPVSAAQIVTVQGVRVHQSIAANVDKLLTAMKAAGYSPGGGGYRDPAGQIATRKNNCGSSHYAIYEMPSKQCKPPTARPGKSMHERGLAIDFTCSGKLLNSANPCYRWLTLNAANYGLQNYPVEPWHWSTNGH